MRLLLPIAIAFVLTACGGGSSDSISPAPTGTESILTTSPAPRQIFCGHQSGPNTLTGVVTAVHDGDTLTLPPYTVRLASIDAPELAQEYGTAARNALAAKVLGKKVSVTFANPDQYGRIVGTVYSDTCDLVNLSQVVEGAAWYYEAYQCEISSGDRDAYANAQTAAKFGKRGLWADPNALAPWEYRNGKSPAVPNCVSNDAIYPASGYVLRPGMLPVTDIDAPDSSTDVSTPPPTTIQPPVTITPRPPVITTPDNCSELVWVDGYTRADGTKVKGHYRRRPGCA